MSVFFYRLPCFRSDFQIICGTEADCPEHTQVIFLKSPCTVADSPQNAFLQIVDAVVKVDYFHVFRIIKHGIDSKITTFGISFEIFGILNFFGMSAIHVQPFLSGGCNFKMEAF